MGKEPEIKILDTVHCKADKEAREAILPCLKVKKQIMKKEVFGSSPDVKVVHMITGHPGTAGHFFTGLLPRIKNFCHKKGMKIKFTGKAERIEATARPKLKGVKFRPDQRKAFRAIKKKQRGKVVFPTGSGKTVIALGAFSMYPDCRRLFLCHTKDLLEQTIEEIEKQGWDYFAIGGGRKFIWQDIEKAKAPIVVAIINSFSNIDVKKYLAFFDFTVVDEVHHVNAKGSQYGHVMTHNLSPIRIGLTATEPTDYEQFLVNEGFFGPVITEMSIEEGIEKGIIAVPQINLIVVPYNVEINKKGNYKYKHLYEEGIVKNKARNKAIMDEAVLNTSFGHSNLIVVERVEHGELIQKEFLKVGWRKHKIPFIHGGAQKERRKKVKMKLQEKKIHCVICTRVWKEGINIPTLNHVILASGMKDEKQVIQAIGRGFRTTKEKTKVKLTDFLDPYRFLAEHSIARIQIYRKNKWI